MLPHRLPHHRLPFGGVTAADIAEVDLVVFAAQRVTGLDDELVHFRHRGAFFAVGADMQNLRGQSFVIAG